MEVRMHFTNFKIRYNHSAAWWDVEGELVISPGALGDVIINNLTLTEENELDSIFLYKDGNTSATSRAYFNAQILPEDNMRSPFIGQKLEGSWVVRSQVTTLNPTNPEAVIIVNRELPEDYFPNLSTIANNTARPARKGKTAIAYDGLRIWFFYYQTVDEIEVSSKNLRDFYYLKGHPYANLVSQTILENYQHNSVGGAEIYNDKLYLTGSYLYEISIIDLKNKTIEKKIQFPDLTIERGGNFADVAFDGTYIWVAQHTVHGNQRSLPADKRQSLMKIDPNTEQIIAEYPLRFGSENDAAHGLCWDGSNIIHGKDNIISKYNPNNGNLVGMPTVVSGVQRISAITVVDNRLYILGFFDKLKVISI